ncbi:protein AF-10-like isoform X3 [Argiope bruennichi]|uniref:protein AF-10-like isoform X3 n=1 Tax=Argiope bruennichi TaxID=94029 RepID=UPI0024956AF6|nr:protein AF-10-like isoform X3 [Argiope bruennichi]
MVPKKSRNSYRCELCPSKDGALKRTDGGGWAHVVCALYIPEVRFGNVTTMEPIILQLVPQERYNKTCCICEEQGKESKASVGACMQCNKSGCKQYFHVTCAQAAGLLCEEAGNYTDNVKYCGYCYYHYQKLVSNQQSSCKNKEKKDSHIKIIPAFKPIPADNATPEPSPEKITSAHLKEKTTRSKADRKGRQAVYTNNSVSANNTETSSPNLATNIEQEFLSDSSTSTISNSSLNNGITVNNSDSRNSDIKTKKNDLHANSNSSIGSKFNSNFKDSNATPSGSPVHNNEKPKKKSKDSGATSSKKNVQESKDLQDISTKSAAPTFSSMYENFISKDLDSNQNSKNDKKRSSDFPEEPEKKKSKHSRSKSKLKSIIESVIPPEKSNPQIPIVRIKRKFNHDRSCSSHSVEEVSVDAPKDYETIIDKIDPESVPEPVKPTEGEIILNSNPSPPIRNPPGEKNESLPLLNDAEIKTEEPSFYDIPRTSYVIPIPDTVNLMDKLSKQMPDSPTVAEDNMQQPAPTTLEELLEKQWVETSNFLISQGQHFDVASMISCLHELRNENNRLEKQISDLVSRRDSLLSINARLKVLPGSAENSMSNNMHYSPLSLLNAKPISPERHISAATANFTGYTLFDNALVHSAQWNNAFSNPLDPTRRDFISHKSPMTGHSPIATVGTSSLPLTPSPIPCSPISKNEVYPHLSAFSHESSPLSHIPNVTNTTSQSSHLYGPSVAISDSLLINETSSYNTLNCPNGSNDAQDEQPTTAVYQTISPPFSNPETDSPNNTSLHSVCSNIVFHPNFENALQNNSRLEDER